MMIKKKKYPILFFIILVLFSCSGAESENDIQKDTPDNKGISFFEETDTLISDTECGNFFEKYLINDTSYVWTWGDDSARITLDTIKDGQISEYFVHWESDDMLCLELSCGSNCWSNRIVRLNRSPIIIECSYSYLDSDCMNIVEILEDEFRVINLVNLDTIIIANNYYSYRNDGYPPFFTNINEFSNSRLIYGIEDSEGSVHVDTIAFKFPCPEYKHLCFHE